MRVSTTAVLGGLVVNSMAGVIPREAPREDQHNSKRQIFGGLGQVIGETDIGSDPISILNSLITDGGVLGGIDIPAIVSDLGGLAGPLGTVSTLLETGGLENLNWVFGEILYSVLGEVLSFVLGIFPGPGPMSTSSITNAVASLRPDQLEMFQTYLTNVIGETPLEAADLADLESALDEVLEVSTGLLGSLEAGEVATQAIVGDLDVGILDTLLDQVIAVVEQLLEAVGAVLAGDLPDSGPDGSILDDWINGGVPVLPGAGEIVSDLGDVAPDTGDIAPDTGDIAPDTGDIAPDLETPDLGEPDVGLGVPAESPDLGVDVPDAEIDVGGDPADSLVPVDDGLTNLIP